MQFRFAREILASSAKPFKDNEAKDWTTSGSSSESEEEETNN